jgi:hypothetical protein
MTGRTGVRLVKLSAGEPVPEKSQRCTNIIAAGVYLLSVSDPTFA